MAETLISPGNLANENDSSQITAQPIQAGAAIIGPTVRGQVNIPKLVTTYSEYQATFGTIFDSGSDEYSFLTSISAYNYFQNGGTSLIVTRVASGSFTSATSSGIVNNIESGDIVSGTDVLGSVTSGGVGGTAGTYSDISTTTDGNGTGLTLNIVTSDSNGKLLGTADALLSSITTNVADGTDATYNNVALTGGSGNDAEATVTVNNNAITGITVTTTGSDYQASDLLTITGTSIGASTNATITLASADLFIEPIQIITEDPGLDYSEGDTITVASGSIGTTTEDLVLTLVDNDIRDEQAFILDLHGRDRY